MKTFFRVSANQINGLRALIKLLPPDSMGVEVGSAYGESMAIFMKSGRVKEMLCVDTWEGDKAEREAVFDQRAAKWPDRVHKAKAASTRVAGGYKPLGGNKIGCCQLNNVDPVFKIEKRPSFDFVYIDAAHDYASIYADIQAWLPLVKVGGFIAGHDYMHDVKRAVDQIFGRPDKTFDDSSWLKYK